MGSYGRTLLLMAALVLFAALAASAAALRGRHLVQAPGNVYSTADTAMETAAPQHKASEHRLSSAPHQGHRSWSRRRRLAQIGGAIAASVVQREVADRAQGQQRQPDGDNASSSGGRAQPPSQQPYQGDNNASAGPWQAQSTRQQSNQGYYDPGTERAQTQTPQPQTYQGDNYNAATWGQTPAPRPPSEEYESSGRRMLAILGRPIASGGGQKPISSRQSGSASLSSALTSVPLPELRLHTLRTAEPSLITALRDAAAAPAAGAAGSATARLTNFISC